MKHHTASIQSPDSQRKIRKRPVRHKANPAEFTVASKKKMAIIDKKIDEQLTAIYRDDNGHMPDMREIKLKTGWSITRFFGLLLTVGTLMALAIGTGLFLLPGNQRFADNQVHLEITGPRELELGEEATFTILYQNRLAEPLHNALLQIRYPAGLVFVTSSVPFKNSGHNEVIIDEIPARSATAIRVIGRLFGEINQEQSWRVALNYQPRQELTSPLQKNATFTVAIKQSPLEMTLAGPGETTLNKEAEYIFTVASNKTAPLILPDIALVPLLPAHFNITSSTPVLNKKTHWTIPGAEWASATGSPRLVFTLRGMFTEASGASSTAFAGRLEALLPGGEKTYALAERSVITKIRTDSVQLALAVNGSVDEATVQPGGALTFSVRIKNSTPDTLTNGTLRLAVDSPSINKQSVLNWPEIEDAFDGDIRGEQLSDSIRHAQIVWDKKKIPDLASIKPGQEIVVDVRLPIRDHQQFPLDELSEYLISALTEFSFTRPDGRKDKTLISPLKILLNSDLALERRLEPVTAEGDTETLPVTWVITNRLHSLKNVVASAEIYGTDVSWRENNPPPAGESHYDASEKRLTWTIPEIPQSLDVLAWPFTITLSKRNPTQNMLMSKIRVRAEDTVTGKTIEFLVDELPLKNN